MNFPPSKTQKIFASFKSQEQEERKIICCYLRTFLTFSTTSFSSSKQPQKPPSPGCLSFPQDYFKLLPCMLSPPAHSVTTSLSNGELCRRVEFVFPKNQERERIIFRIGEFSRRKIKKIRPMLKKNRWRRERWLVFVSIIVISHIWDEKSGFFATLYHQDYRTIIYYYYTTFFSYIHGEINCVRALFLQKNPPGYFFLSPRVFGKTLIASFVLLKKVRATFFSVRVIHLIRQSSRKK